MTHESSLFFLCSWCSGCGPFTIVLVSISLKLEILVSSCVLYLLHGMYMEYKMAVVWGSRVHRVREKRYSGPKKGN